MEFDLHPSTLKHAIQVIKGTWGKEPHAAILTGSGLSGITKELKLEAAISYTQLPGLSESTAPGHGGYLNLGTIEDIPVMVFQGRSHCYEGWPIAKAGWVSRIVKEMGTSYFIITNAAGGLSPDLESGDLVMLKDHINLMGGSPLAGTNHEKWGPRFPDMFETYDYKLRDLALTNLHKMRHQKQMMGVYAGVLGPQLETPAEYQMLRTLGADLVGMSTVPEAITAAHCSLPVLAISVVTDLCDPLRLKRVKISEILETAAKAEPYLQELITSVLKATWHERNLE